MFSIQILMQTVVVTSLILQEQRRRLGLTCRRAAREKVGVLTRVADAEAHRFVPTIGDGRKTRIKRRPQTPDGVGQRVCEILVFATPKPVPAHDNSTSETIVVAIE